MNLTAATSLLEDNHSISLRDGKLVRDEFTHRLLKFMRKSYRDKHLFLIIDLIKSEALRDIGEKEPSFLAFADAFLLKNRNIKRLRTPLLELDHLLRQNKGGYVLEENKRGLTLWKKCGQEEKVFRSHFEFSQFAIKSTLALQMKPTRDILKLNKDSIPLIPIEIPSLVKGKIDKAESALPFDEFIKDYTYSRNKNFKDEIVIVNRNNYTVYTYLDNGKGLQAFNPRRIDLMNLVPISTISHEDYKDVRDAGREFVRPSEVTLSEVTRHKKNNKRDYILQVVSSYVEDNKEDSWQNNFRNFITRRKHPYLRVVTPEGKVYEIGYGWERSHLMLMQTFRGQFRSPDAWEYKTPTKRIVTNIAIDEKEKDRFLEYVKYYENRNAIGFEMSFNLLLQNCSAFVSKSVLYSTGITLPTEMNISDVINRIMPDKIRELQQKIVACANQTLKFVAKPLPMGLQKNIKKVATLIWEIWRSARAFMLSMFILSLGGNKGIESQEFKIDDNPIEMKPILRDSRRWYDLKRYNFHFPALLQEWQINQCSTRTYHHESKFAICPTKGNRVKTAVYTASS